MKTQAIRDKFVYFFQEKLHAHLDRANLLNKSDPSLLFVNAGMVQFKPWFLGKKPSNKRAVTIQPCLRVGGKHNDLQNVGHTARHHTLFEMLGNFSFGDYFKKDAIAFAWEFLTKQLEIPVEKLWVTVHYSDQESKNIWINDIHVSPDRVIECDDEDNFWSMGDTGPCGPCTEIFYDHGEGVPGGPPGSNDADGDRYVEIWNLVFMAFNRETNGQMTDLPNPCVDTGMGLERIAAVLQSKQSNYDTDQFKNIINGIKNKLSINDESTVTLQVVADHIRSILFLLIDGLQPGNEGAEYVLRRIIRRALRYLYQAGINEPCLFKLLPLVVFEMGKAYPEIKKGLKDAQTNLKTEEQRFFKTLDAGMKILNEHLNKDKNVSGELAFKLYDTYGFPVDITEDVAKEQGGSVDHAQYNKCMQKQKERSLKSQKFRVMEHLDLSKLPKTTFVGHESMDTEATVLAAIQDNQLLDTLQGEGVLILNKTTFYPEGGGQVGDKGTIIRENERINVVDTQIQEDIILHTVKCDKAIKKGDTLKLLVDQNREHTKRHHSATHLLHKALKNVLGDDVCQKGSLVTPERLRFDFNYPKSLSHNQLSEIEKIVNDAIQTGYPVVIEKMTFEAAQKAGAISLFGEKYPSPVRVLSMGDFSKELCGGTHVSNTNEVIYFKILNESAVASGVRRIEAVAGYKAIEHFLKLEHIVNKLKKELKVSSSDLSPKVLQLLNDKSLLEQKLKKAKAQHSQWLDYIDIKGKHLYYGAVDVDDVQDLLIHIDHYRKDPNMVALLYFTKDNVSRFVIAVSNTISTFNAKEVLSHLSGSMTIKGGGKDHLVQGVMQLKLKESEKILATLQQWIGDKN